jgi:uncharacterized membrane-anchored protein
MDRRVRFGAMLLVQLAILAAVPHRQVLARSRGREITLRTAPVDPFSPFGGYYMTLRYEAETPTLEMIPKGIGRNDVVYLVVEQGEPAWTLVGLSRALPPAAPNRVALRARWDASWQPSAENVRWFRVPIESAGRFYLPEEKAKALEKAMADEWKRVRELPFEEQENAMRTRMLVDLRVDGAGNVALVRLRFGSLTFEE